MKAICPGRKTALLVVFGVMTILAASLTWPQSVSSRSATANSRGSMSQSHFSATPVPFAQAEQARKSAQRLPKGNAVRMTAEEDEPVATPPEIVELARALKNDPDLIYQYVHDNIEFTPLFGSLKGAVGTLIDGRGNSFDQSSLMVALLKQASLENPAISDVLFQYGQLSLSSAQLQSWLGVDDDPGSVNPLCQQ